MVWSIRRPWLVTALVAVVLMALVVALGVRAQSAGASRCERFHADSRARAAADERPEPGAAQRIVVIGDSWAAGLGLDRVAGSWPSRLPGAVHVAGFSGSGFSARASGCARVAFGDRAASALRGGADLVVVEGGLNDYDQPDADVRAGFARLMAELRGHQVVVVGPAAAPARARGVARIDALLASLAAQYDIAYIDTTGLDLPYLDDRLHLTPAGHTQFGDYVAARLSG